MTRDEIDHGPVNARERRIGASTGADIGLEILKMGDTLIGMTVVETDVRTTARRTVRGIGIQDEGVDRHTSDRRG